MYRVNISNPAQQRTIRPIYAHTQATPYAGFLDPTLSATVDIYPGTVMARKTKEQFTVYTGAAGQVPFGLSALFRSPSLRIDEVTDTGTNNFTVWVGDSQAVFEVLAPAFDTGADWSLPADGSRKMLTGNSTGLLTPTGVTSANVVAELIDVIDTDKILIRLNKYDLGTGGNLAGGS